MIARRWSAFGRPIRHEKALVLRKARVAFAAYLGILAVVALPACRSSSDASDRAASGPDGNAASDGASAGLTDASATAQSQLEAGLEDGGPTSVPLQVGTAISYLGGDTANATPPVLAALGDGVVLAGSSADPNVVGVPQFADAAVHSEAFVARLNHAAQTLWTAPLPSAGLPAGVVIDSLGDVVVAAPFVGSVDAVSAGVVGTDLYLAKFGPNGTPIYAKDVAVTGLSPYGGLAPAGIAADSQGAVYVVGQATQQDPNDSTYVWFAKYDENGDTVFSKTFISAPLPDQGSEAAGEAITVLSNDEVAISGSFSILIDFGGGALGSTDGETEPGFLARFAADGTLISSVAFAQGSYGSGSALTPAAGGDLLMAGRGYDPSGLGNATLIDDPGVTANPNWDYRFVARFDRTGTAEWATLLQQPSGLFPAALAVDSAGVARMTGSLGGSVLVASFDERNGAALSNLVVTSSDAGSGVRGSALAVDGAQSLWIAGTFDTDAMLGTVSLTGNSVGVFVARIDPVPSEGGAP